MGRSGPSDPQRSGHVPIADLDGLRRRGKFLVGGRGANNPAAMKAKLENIFRNFIILLLAVLLWSVWRAEAQTSAGPTNAPTTAPASTNAPIRDIPTPEWVKPVVSHFPLLETRWLGNELWKYLFSLVYIFLAFYVSKLLDYLTRVWLKRWAEKTETRFDDLVLDLLNGPVKIVSFVIFLRIGLEVFDWPPMVQGLLTKGFTVVVALSITYTVLKFVDLLMGFWHLRVASESDKAFNEQLFPIVRKTLKVFVVIVATLVTLANIGVNVTAAIASLSIGGLAVGLAAQDTLANLFGAVALFIDKPFRIGDQIKLDAVTGNVETIGLRSTRVRTLDGYLASIPNKTVGNAAIVNVTIRPSIKTEFNIGLTYDLTAAQLRRALALIEEVYRSHPKTADLVVSFNKFGDSALNILVVHWWGGTEAREQLAAMQEMNLKLKERFDAEGLSFAFPTQTLHVRQA
jgi:MscS family membrane protein